MNGFLRSKQVTHELALSLLEALKVPASKLRADGIASRLDVDANGKAISVEGGPMEYLAVVTKTHLILSDIYGGSNRLVNPQLLSKTYPLQELRLKNYKKRFFSYEISLRSGKEEIELFIHWRFKKNNYEPLALYLLEHVKNMTGVVER
jgi:hypothetical protein